LGSGCVVRMCIGWRPHMLGWPASAGLCCPPVRASISSEGRPGLSPSALLKRRGRRREKLQLDHGCSACLEWLAGAGMVGHGAPEKRCAWGKRGWKRRKNAPDGPDYLQGCRPWGIPRCSPRHAQGACTGGGSRRMRYACCELPAGPADVRRRLAACTLCCWRWWLPLPVES